MKKIKIEFHPSRNGQTLFGRVIERYVLNFKNTEQAREFACKIKCKDDLIDAFSITELDE